MITEGEWCLRGQSDACTRLRFTRIVASARQVLSSLNGYCFPPGNPHVLDTDSAESAVMRAVAHHSGFEQICSANKMADCTQPLPWKQYATGSNSALRIDPLVKQE
jgi:hypothetical protein